MEMLQARENLMEVVQAFLKKYDQVPPKAKSMALLLAEERFLKIKQVVEEEENKPESMQEFDTLNFDENFKSAKCRKSRKLNECDMPVCDDSSSKNEGFIVSISPGKEIDHLDTIPDSIQSLLNCANSIIFLIEEFTSKLAPIDPILPRIVEADPKEDIRLIEKLLNDDSFPHSTEELNSKIPDAINRIFSPHIPVEDSDSLMEEIDIFLAPDDSIPPGIEDDDYDSEGDVLFLAELLNNDYISLPEYESFHVDFYNVPSSPRPPKKPPNDDRTLCACANILPTLPTLYPVFDTLLPFSSENEDKVFNPGILISNEEKSPHRGFKVFQLIKDSESPMMIYGWDIPILDVPSLHFYPP
ncbi:hypothetical protein Tco_0199096 [Tanacetum coccineum]